MPEKIPPLKYHTGMKPPGKNAPARELFYFLVKRWWGIPKDAGQFCTSMQLAHFFGTPNDITCFRKVREAYGEFFLKKGPFMFGLDMEAIYAGHPEIWANSLVSPKPKPAPGTPGPTKPMANESSVSEITGALDDEIRASYQPSNQKFIRIYGITKTAETPGIFIYRAKTSEDDDRVILLPEGVKVAFKNGTYRTDVTILEHNLDKEMVVFQTSRPLYAVGEPKLEATTVHLLYRLKELVEAVDPGKNPALLLSKRQYARKRLPFHSPVIGYGLDQYQQKTLNDALTHNYTYIWGPPGTGKSFTLARVLLNLFREGERTLVVSIANVAVDAITEKTIDVMKEYEQKAKEPLLKTRKVLRIGGFVQSKKLLDIQELFPEDQHIRMLREQILKLEQVLEEKQMAGTKRDELLSLRNTKKRELSEHLRKRIQEARTVFCTASKAEMEDFILNGGFDNLVIDEGSMMSIPHLVALSAAVSKRIIIAGDFRQLGPVVLSSSSRSEKWLKKDLFSLLANHDAVPDHPAVCMLQLQRRSAGEITSLINAPFYKGKLVATEDGSHNACKHLQPLTGKHICFWWLKSGGEMTVLRSASHSRYNEATFRRVVGLVKSMIHDKAIRSIGIISTYREQCNKYKRKFEELGRDASRIKCGTIHSFQGSEADVIIWDLVDAMNEPAGQLYCHNEGERLVNVAISRAISKLVIVGDPTVFIAAKNSEQVSPKVKEIFRQLKTEHSKKE